MEKTPKKLTLLIYIFTYFYHASLLHAQNTVKHPIITCLNNHKLTNFSTHSSPIFHHFLNFSLQNLRANKHPKPYAIILPETKEQLINSVLCCKSTFLEITVRSGGHSYEGMSSISRDRNPFVIIDMINLNRVVINVDSETAWVEGGATLGELYTAVAEQSGTLGFPAGVGPTVGVGGHFSGGGIGLMSRMYGLSADNVVDLVLVDAEGRSLGREDMDEDVFWAVRGGGGGNFGVVYSWTVKLVKVSQNVTCFKFTKQSRNVTQLATLLYKWQFVAPKLKDEFYLAAYLSSSTNSEEVYITFIGFYLGPKLEAMSVINSHFPELEMREEAYNEMSWINSVLYFSGLPKGSTINDLKSRYFLGKSCVKTKSDYVRHPISISGLEGALKMVALEPKGLVILDPYGGIMDRISSDAIPFPHRKGNLYNVLYVAFWNEKDDQEPYLSWIRKFYDYMTPFASSNPRAAYVNYVDLDLGILDETNQKSIDWGEKYFLSNYERLVKAKTIIDPNNVFSHLQGISPANNVALSDEL